MILKTVKIKNFRGYQTETIIPISNLTAFIGKNDAGKSTILEALEIFFNNSLVNCEKDDLNITADNNKIEITCIFSDFPAQLIIDAANPTTLQAEHLLNTQNKLEIKKVFAATAAKPKEKVFIICNHPSIANGNDLLTLKKAELKQRATALGIPTANYNGNVNSSIREAIRDSFGNLELQETELLVDKEDTKKVYDTLKSYLPLYALFQSDRQSKDDDKEVTDPMKIAVQQALSELTVELEHIKEQVRIKAIDTANRTLAKLKEM
jgi:putative ATP-dependent endonuclease of OLD family